MQTVMRRTLFSFDLMMSAKVYRFLIIFYYYYILSLYSLYYIIYRGYVHGGEGTTPLPPYKIRTHVYVFI